MNRLLLAAILLSAGAYAANAQDTKQERLWDASIGLGFPNFISAQGARHLTEKLTVGASVGTSFIPESTKPCGAKVKMSGVDFELVSRYHFFETSFFGGLNFGYQDFKVKSVQDTIPGGDYNITDGVKVFYITPHIGWFKT